METDGLCRVYQRPEPRLRVDELRLMLATLPVALAAHIAYFALRERV